MDSDEALTPTLVLLPGLDGTGKLFAEFIKALDLGIGTHIAVPYPPDVPWGYDELESLVRAVLPVRGPFVLLGESLSGPLAIRIAELGSGCNGSPGEDLGADFGVVRYARPDGIRRCRHEDHARPPARATGRCGWTASAVRPVLKNVRTRCLALFGKSK